MLAQTAREDGRTLFAYHFPFMRGVSLTIAVLCRLLIANRSSIVGVNSIFRLVMICSDKKTEINLTPT